MLGRAEAWNVSFMTILVAVKKNGRVCMGADRITTFGNEYRTDIISASKIIRLPNAYLSSSGYTLLDNIIEHLFASGSKLLENPFDNRSDVFTFFLGLYNELKKNYTLTDSGKETFANLHNVFLAVTSTSIYGVSSNLSVHEYERFAAQGAGADYALGCLYGTYDTVDDAGELVRIALEAACHFSIYCKEASLTGLAGDTRRMVNPSELSTNAKDPAISAGSRQRLRQGMSAEPDSHEHLAQGEITNEMDSRATRPSLLASFTEQHRQACLNLVAYNWRSRRDSSQGRIATTTTS